MNASSSPGDSGSYFARYDATHRAVRASSSTRWARPSTETHSTVSSIATTAWGLAARLRAFRERGPHEKPKRHSSSSQTPHTGSACGRPSPVAVTTQ